MNHPDAGSFAIDPHQPAGQLGALCWRLRRGRTEVLLITSRDTGRWVIPKGWPHEGQGGPASAAAEAWEEAGVEGKVRDAPMGLYSYDKLLKPGRSQPCVVTVFALRVARLRHRFPERGERQRKWFDAGKAARRVAEPELRVLLLAVAADAGLLVGVAKA